MDWEGERVGKDLGKGMNMNEYDQNIFRFKHYFEK